MRHAWIGNLALACGSVVFTLAVGEGAARLAGYSGFERYQPDPVLGWVLTPNQDARTKIGGLPVHIDSSGFRAPDISWRKPPHTVRIFSLGNSATFGWGVRQDEVYHQVFARMLNDSARAAHDSTHFEVVNAGVNAYALDQVATLLPRIASRYNPDGFLVAYTFNDEWNRFGSQTAEERHRMLLGVRAKDLLRRSALYNWLIEIEGRRVYDRLRTQLGSDAAAHTGGARLATADLARYRRTLMNIAADAKREHRALVFVTLTAKDETAHSPRAQAMLDVASEQHVPALDLLPAFGGGGAHDALYLEGDGVHPNARGDSVIGVLLYREVCGAARNAPAGDPIGVFRPGCGRAS